MPWHALPIDYPGEPQTITRFDPELHSDHRLHACGEDLKL
jgi:hypothetical protein